MGSAASMKEFRAHAEHVRNWGRWGSDDEIGTLNFITPDKLKAAAGLVRTGRLFSLGVNLDLNGPMRASTAIRWNPMHFVSVGGDYEQEGEFIRASDDPRAQMISGAHDVGIARITDDFLIMPTQSGTHWDGLAHIYYEAEMYNGFPSRCLNHFGTSHLGIDHAGRNGVTARGVLLDVVRHRGVEWVAPTDPAIEPEELEDVARAQGVALEGGDIVLVRTGWWERFLTTRDHDLGNGGLSWRCARWLHDHDVAALAADNSSVELEAMQVEGVVFAMHCLCLRDMGLMFGEMWNLAELAADCAADGVYEFLVSAPPIAVTGGLGSPLNPIAIK